MSFKELYSFRQALPEYVTRKEVKEAAENFSGKRATIYVTGKLEISIARGQYIDVSHSAHPFVKQTGTSMIMCARGNNKCWQRLVVFKELMHLFDNHFESTSSADDVERLINEFVQKNPENSPMMKSEGRALWMGLSLFCREEQRIDLARKRANGAIEDEDIATLLRMPQQYLPHLFSPTYKEIIAPLVD